LPWCWGFIVARATSGAASVEQIFDRMLEK
jgi:hypothetical protein